MCSERSEATAKLRCLQVHFWQVFPAWLRLATTGDRYTPYNLGQPRSVPIRSGGMDAFHDDPSITRFGGITAELIGREIAAMKFPITGVYSSPALR